MGGESQEIFISREKRIWLFFFILGMTLLLLVAVLLMIMKICNAVVVVAAINIVMFTRNPKFVSFHAKVLNCLTHHIMTAMGLLPPTVPYRIQT